MSVSFIYLTVCASCQVMLYDAEKRPPAHHHNMQQDEQTFCKGVSVIPTRPPEIPPWAEQLSLQSDLQTSPLAIALWRHRFLYEGASGEVYAMMTTVRGWLYILGALCPLDSSDAHRKLTCCSPPHCCTFVICRARRQHADSSVANEHTGSP